MRCDRPRTGCLRRSQLFTSRIPKLREHYFCDATAYAPAVYDCLHRMFTSLMPKLNKCACAYRSAARVQPTARQPRPAARGPPVNTSPALRNESFRRRPSWRSDLLCGRWLPPSWRSIDMVVAILTGGSGSGLPYWFRSGFRSAILVPVP
jgi:hypothetical protein